MTKVSKVALITMLSVVKKVGGKQGEPGAELHLWCTLKYAGISVQNEYTIIRGKGMFLLHNDRGMSK